MLKLIVANGCSCTRGEELQFPDVDAWPAVLSQLLDVEVLSIARDGSSNRRIVRSSTTTLDRIAAGDTYSPAEVLVLVAWTQLARSEYYSSVEPDERREGPQDGVIDHGWQRIGPWRDRDRHRPTRAFYRHLWSDEGQFRNFALDWSLFDGWCQSRGFRSAYAFAFPLPRIGFASEGPLADIVDMLPLERTLGRGLWKVGNSMLEMPRHHKRGPGGHPLKTGHEWFANKLADWLRTDIA